MKRSASALIALVLLFVLASVSVSMAQVRDPYWDPPPPPGTTSPPGTSSPSATPSGSASPDCPFMPGAARVDCPDPGGPYVPSINDGGINGGLNNGGPDDTEV